MDWTIISALAVAATSIMQTVIMFISLRMAKANAPNITVSAPKKPAAKRFLSFTIMVIWDVFAILLLGWILVTSDGGVAVFAAIVLVLIIVLFGSTVALEIASRQQHHV
jgi:hypothetical protein